MSACSPCTTFLHAENPKATKYCRFQSGETIAYGIVEGETITELDGDLFGKWKKTDKTHKLTSVKLLAPCKPTQVLAMAGNFKSHLGIDDHVTTITTTTKLTTDKAGQDEAGLEDDMSRSPSPARCR